MIALFTANNQSIQDVMVDESKLAGEPPTRCLPIEEAFTLQDPLSPKTQDTSCRYLSLTHYKSAK